MKKYILALVVFCFTASLAKERVKVSHEVFLEIAKKSDSTVIGTEWSWHRERVYDAGVEIWYEYNVTYKNITYFTLSDTKLTFDSGIECIYTLPKTEPAGRGGGDY